MFKKHWFFTVVVLVIGVISCVTSRPQSHSAREPGSLYGTSTDLAEPLDFKTLRKIVEDNQLSNIDSLLAILSKKFPRYLAYHTFMYDSQSIQSASYQYPRAIVFGPEAKFIFSFNSRVNSDSTGFDGIEAMEFSDQTASFELHEIRFRDDATDTADFTGKPYVVSSANPEKCMACHSGIGENHWISANGFSYDPYVHPIWDTYFIWRGAYGSADDDRDPPPVGHGFFFRDHHSRESLEKEKFYAKDGNRFKGRYRYLPTMQADMDGANSFMTAALAKENFFRIARRLAIPELKKRRYELLAAASCGHRDAGPDRAFLQKYFDAPVIADFKKYQEAYLGELNQRLQSVLTLEKRPLEDVSDIYNEMKDNGLVNNTAFVFSPAMTLAKSYGIETSDWALRATPSGKGFVYGTIYFNYYTSALIHSLFSPEEQKELAAMAPEDADYIDPKLCDTSLRRLNGT